MITSRQNSKLKTMRRLLRCKGAGALIEGPHLVSEALAAGIDLDPVLVTPQFAASAEGRELLARLPHAAEPVEPALLEALADADSPRGIVAAAGLRRARLEDLPVTRDGVYLYVDRLQDPGNLGALARTAEAAGTAGSPAGIRKRKQPLRTPPTPAVRYQTSPPCCSSTSRTLSGDRSAPASIGCASHRDRASALTLAPLQARSISQ